MFPGQGSQFVGMGAEVFEKYRDQVSLSSEILGYDVAECCLRDRNRMLNETHFTQPLVYVVNALSFQHYIDAGGVTPNYFIGHSLGEYNALLAAGVFSFKIGLMLVKKRGELFWSIKNGGMLAVVDDCKTVLSLLDNNSSIEVANYNSDNQIILSGHKSSLDDLYFKLKDMGIKSIPLNVSGAFHSSFMEPAKIAFQRYLQEFTFSAPQVPVISNVSTEFYNLQKTKEMLVDQITHSVLWKNQVQYLLDLGVTNFVEVGPGKVLSRIVQKIKSTHTFANRSTLPSEPKHSVQNKLGNPEFLKRYRVERAYVIGGMYKAISSAKLVVKAANSNILSFYGTGGVSLEKVDDDIQYIKKNLVSNKVFGVNFLHYPMQPEHEMALANLCLKHNIEVIEASAFTKITLPLVYFRCKSLHKSQDGKVIIKNKVIAKVSHPEIAKAFLSPPPANYVEKLLSSKAISLEQAHLSKSISMADDITVEADSGGHTDQKAAFVLIPEIIRLKNNFAKAFSYPIHVGAAGGIGSPEAVFSAFMLGADYVVTGSINQCTVEAGTSVVVKQLLSTVDIHDMAIAPAGDMLEYGAKVQVVKKGSLFHTRASKLYELYKKYNNIDELTKDEKETLEKIYFKCSINEVQLNVESYVNENRPELRTIFQKNPKLKMAQIFKWYFYQSTLFALNGEVARKLDFQVQCGPALGAFNQWVKGSSLEKWENRHVDAICIYLMDSAENMLYEKYKILAK